jgi:hypothetical protein
MIVEYIRYTIDPSRADEFDDGLPRRKKWRMPWCPRPRSYPKLAS